MERCVGNSWWKWCYEFCKNHLNCLKFLLHCTRCSKVSFNQVIHIMTLWHKSYCLNTTPFVSLLCSRGSLDMATPFALLGSALWHVILSRAFKVHFNNRYVHQVLFSAGSLKGTWEDGTEPDDRNLVGTSRTSQQKNMLCWSFPLREEVWIWQIYRPFTLAWAHNKTTICFGYSYLWLLLSCPQCVP